MKIAVCNKNAIYLQELKTIFIENLAENNLQAKVGYFTESKGFLYI